MPHRRLLALCLMLTAAGPAATRPTPPLYADATRLGRPFAKDPSVVKFHDRYWMYYSVPPADRSGLPKGWAIGVATSDGDLDRWTKAGEVLPDGGDVERAGICAPGARVLDGKVHLFYQNYTAGPRDAICHAWSDDGLHFTRDPSNPVFRPTGAWTNGRAIDADVVPWHGKLWLYCATRDPAGKVQQITGAVADAAGDPTTTLGRGAWRQLGDGPLLKPTLPWERDCIEAPTVVARGDTLVMVYAGAYNNAPQQIGSAASTDGVHWTRQSDHPLLPVGPRGSWNASESGHPGLFVDDDGTTSLFYQGNPDRGRTWLIARASVRWDGDRPVVDRR